MSAFFPDIVEKKKRKDSQIKVSFKKEGRKRGKKGKRRKRRKRKQKDIIENVRMSVCGEIGLFFHLLICLNNKHKKDEF